MIKSDGVCEALTPLCLNGPFVGPFFFIVFYCLVTRLSFVGANFFVPLKTNFHDPFLLGCVTGLPFKVLIFYLLQLNS